MKGMNQSDFNNLVTHLGQEAISKARMSKPKEADFLAHYQQLQRIYPDGIARAALETAILRLEAQSKFPFAEKLYLTRSTMEQATAFPVSAYRAQRYCGCERILDLGCSVGGDTIALAQVSPTTGVDLDPLRLAMAQQNLHNLGLAADFVQADLTRALPLDIPGAAIFFDPARRVDHRRMHNVEDYRPPLSVVSEWLPQHPGNRREDFPRRGPDRDLGVSGRSRVHLAGWRLEGSGVVVRGLPHVWKTGDRAARRTHAVG